MPKRTETIELENALIKMCREKRLYGCEEVTIGFYNNGHGNEIVDFMTMDSKGIIKCYEIKVTLSDLKSNAKKSWYGNYNYLVVSSELYKTVDKWIQYIPNDVGIIEGFYLNGKRKCKKKEITEQCDNMLKESLVRSMYWKMEKYRDLQSIEKHKKIMSEIRRAEKEKNSYYQRLVKAEKIISDYETYKSADDGIKDIDLEQMAKEEKEKYRKNRKIS